MFKWCFCGFTICILIFSSSRYFLTVLEAKMKMILKMGLKYLSVKYVMLSLNVSTVNSFSEYFTGLARMALDD